MGLILLSITAFMAYTFCKRNVDKQDSILENAYIRLEFKIVCHTLGKVATVATVQNDF